MKKRQERRVRRGKERDGARKRERTVLWASLRGRWPLPPLSFPPDLVFPVHMRYVLNATRATITTTTTTTIAVGDSADVSITFRCERARPTTRSSAAYRHHPRASVSSLTLGSGYRHPTHQSALWYTVGLLDLCEQRGCVQIRCCALHARPIENIEN